LRGSASGVCSACIAEGRLSFLRLPRTSSGTRRTEFRTRGVRRQSPMRQVVTAGVTFALVQTQRCGLAGSAWLSGSPMSTSARLRRRSVVRAVVRPPRLIDASRVMQRGRAEIGRPSGRSLGSTEKTRLLSIAAGPGADRGILGLHSRRKPACVHQRQPASGRCWATTPYQSAFGSSRRSPWRP
jgi:hypothetical protein